VAPGESDWLVIFTAGWGLWRSLVAHLVRIEGARGSNPLSSTTQVNSYKGFRPPA
jgi:hypothetical protein